MIRPQPPRQQPRRKRYNETPPLSLRIGAIRDELDARSDGTEAGYRKVIMECLRRYFDMVNHITFDLDATHAKHLLQHGWTGYPPDIEDVALVDKIGKAHVLIAAGLSVDEALRKVGLVKE